MIQPIYVYDQQILVQKCLDIPHDLPILPNLILDLWDTMRNAQGCGLSAPQIGLPYNVFVIDSQNAFQAIGKGFRKRYFDTEDKGIQEIFINPQLLEVSSKMWKAEEGCLSLPSLIKEVSRPWLIKISYYNEQLEHHVQEFSGLTARMILHELDHTKGILLINHMGVFTKKYLYFKLKSIKKGRVKVSYPISTR
ncbi:peptide deformylase [Flectobacillus longus]|jgi:peptide deformylase|uniref:Peptide deformylase n=1 Tax=Flectobacillus longus TaxID=2984207 RepID=A0ABT6YJT0_9BACT|nr:peptide deformylase [Flectobacillus longus]MDI9863834.1 peptide deformylase [Flectobacillus longus]MDI9879812.1 peptide deformylase [Flectobacillus longus]